MVRLALILFMIDNNIEDFKTALLTQYPDITLTPFWNQFERLNNKELSEQINQFVSSTADKRNKFKNISIIYDKTRQNWTTESDAKETIRLLPTNQQIVADKITSRGETSPEWYITVAEILGGTSETNQQIVTTSNKPNFMVIGLVGLVIFISFYYLLKKSK